MSAAPITSTDRPMSEVWQRIQHVVTPPEWELIRPIIEEIRELKHEKNVTILAHNYQPVEIYWGVADHTGDSLQLAQIAKRQFLENVLFAGVTFMAETVKILSPETNVWIPSLDAGCSLAESITAEDVRELRRQHPNAAVVTYVNSSAAVKAESDICCTSSNALTIVNALPHDEIIFIPDRHLASFVMAQTSKTIHTWRGHCDVHDVFSVDDVNHLRWRHPDIHVLAHPECKRDVQSASDFVGSTSALASYIELFKPRRAALITECTMSANVAAACPNTEFVQPCSLCPHMRRISLAKILTTLKTDQHRVEVPPMVSARARRSIEAMLEVTP